MTRKEQREKKRNARKALMFFLKRGCKACSAYSTAHDWYEEAKKVKNLLAEYSDVLPEKPLAKVNETLNLVDVTDAGVSKVCKVLKYDLKRLAKRLPILGGTSAFLVKGLVTVAVIAGAGSVLWSASKVKLTIVNENCTPLPIASKLPSGFADFMDRLGVNLPLWVVAGGRESFSLPPVTLAVSSSESSMDLSVLGQSIGFSLPNGISSITFNGREILNTETSLNFREQKNHTVVLRCE